jgi:hypothetical protein
MKEDSKTTNVPTTGPDAIRPSRHFFPGLTDRGRGSLLVTSIRQVARSRTVPKVLDIYFVRHEQYGS